MRVAISRICRLLGVDRAGFESKRQRQTEGVESSTKVGGAGWHRDANHEFSVVSLTTTTANCDPNAVTCAAGRRWIAGGGLRSTQAARCARGCRACARNDMVTRTRSDWRAHARAAAWAATSRACRVRGRNRVRRCSNGTDWVLFALRLGDERFEHGHAGATLNSFIRQCRSGTQRHCCPSQVQCRCRIQHHHVANRAT